MLGDIEQKKVKKTESIEEIEGSLKSEFKDKKLMKSVLEADKNVIDDGKLIKEALNQSMSGFTPDMLMEQFVKNYKLAKHIFGNKILNQLSGYNEKYIERNIHIPEFQEQLKKKIEKKLEELREKKLLDNNNIMTDKAVELASLVMYVEELDNLMPTGFLGEKIHKKSHIYGDKEDLRNFTKDVRYRDIAIRKSIKTAIRRGHSRLEIKDLKAFERQAKGVCYIVYAIDASGSMKGNKIDNCKKAGIALAYKAIDEKDKVGLIVFSKEVECIVHPTDDFVALLKEITKTKAGTETNIAATIEKANELFPSKDVTKHLMLITDALPTIGKKPEQETLEAASKARANGITISLVGIKLDKKGEKLGKKIVEIGSGRFYIAKDAKNIDKIVLEDYHGIA